MPFPEIISKENLGKFEDEIAWDPWLGLKLSHLIKLNLVCITVRFKPLVIVCCLTENTN